MKVKNVLSLFNGMSCGRIALDRAGIDIDKYYSSEVDKYAIMVADANYPQDVPYKLGDVRFITPIDRIDLLIGGSPCQNFSFAGNQKGLSTKDNIEILTLEHYLQLKSDGFEFVGQSYLFWEYVRILKDIQSKNPDVLFLLENVMMVQKWKDLISETLGVQPIMINSSLVSAQNRKRLYWTNIPGVDQPEDKEIFLKDIVFDDALFPKMKGFFPITPPKTNTGIQCIGGVGHQKKLSREIPQGNRVHSMNGKSPTLNASGGNKSGGSFLVLDDKLFATCLHNLYGGFGEKESRVFQEKSPTIRAASGGGAIPSLLLSEKALDYMDRTVSGGRNHWDFSHHSDVRDNKSKAVVANFFKGVPYNVLKDWNCIRSFDPMECERLQTVPDNYTNHVSKTQRYKMLGNGWTVDVIAHIFKGIINDNN